MAHKADRNPRGGDHTVATTSNPCTRTSAEEEPTNSAAPRIIEASVELSRLISLSSFGTPECREERMLGRQATEEYLAKQIGSSGPLDDGRYDDPVDLAVADKLEARGYTFEAELRYRRLAARSPIAATRLAMMLEMMGRRKEAWSLYLRAAQRNEVNALLRLAVIGHQRGEFQWAVRLIRHAYGLFTEKTRRSISDQVYRACQARPLTEFGGRIAANCNGATRDAVFGLGSFFFVVADRPDLARLTYCCALARGHSLAGVSLLDMTPRPDNFSSVGKSGYLEQLFDEGLNASRYLEYDGSRSYAGADIDRFAPLFVSSMQHATVETMVRALQADVRSRRGSTDARERVLVNARMFTMLLCFRRVGTVGTREKVRRAADKVCGYVAQRVDDGDLRSGRDLINDIWRHAESEVGVLASACATTTKPSTRPKYVRAAGTAYRLGESFRELSPNQTRVLTQRVGGLRNDEVADAMGVDVDETRRLFRSGIVRLRRAQSNHPIPTSQQLLWQDVESSFRSQTDTSQLILDPDDVRIDAGPQEVPARW